MNGQWIAEFDGSPPGVGVLDLELFKDHYEGMVQITYFANIPPVAARIVTPGIDRQQKFMVTLKVIDPRTRMPIEPSEATQLFSGMTFASSAEVELSLKGNHLTAQWTTDDGQHGQLAAPRSKASKPSEYRATRSDRTWKNFREACSELQTSRYIFRGQSRPLRLRSSFHRLGRSDLNRYVGTDLPNVHRGLMGRTRHLFNREVPGENGAFLNLIQHHGYPTPLLDWTESPFVAAFFAYRKARADAEVPVRIFMFDQQEWKRAFQQLQHLSFMGPHLSVLEAWAIENNRALPQQSLSTVTNLDDIETYIRRREMELGRSFLRVFDLPYVSRKTVLRELGLMGVTSASLFPGLDGACEDLRSRHFDFA